MTKYNITWMADGQKRSMKVEVSSKKAAKNVAEQYLIDNFKVSRCKAWEHYSKHTTQGLKPGSNIRFNLIKTSRIVEVKKVVSQQSNIKNVPIK